MNRFFSGMMVGAFVVAFMSSLAIRELKTEAAKEKHDFANKYLADMKSCLGGLESCVETVKKGNNELRRCQ